MTLGRFGAGALLCLIVLSAGCYGSAPQAANEQRSMPEKLSHIEFGGSEGATCEDAVEIRNARNNAEGIAAEKAWISSAFPAAKVVSKAVRRSEGKVFEIVTLSTPDTSEKKVCFDVSDFFGVW